MATCAEPIVPISPTSRKERNRASLYLRPWIILSFDGQNVTSIVNIMNRKLWSICWLSLPRARLVGVISQTLSVFRNPCWRKIALLFIVGSESWPLPCGIRCNSRIYPSAVVTWCTSTGYPRFAIISTYKFRKFNTRRFILN